MTASPACAACSATLRSFSTSTAHQGTRRRRPSHAIVPGRMAAEILVGTCNWADHENFYPPELDKGARQRDKLTYYARFLPVVEIDTTFYGIPKPQVAQGWVDRTPEGFRFNVKAYKALTRHEREDGRPRPPTREEEFDFLESLNPLREPGRLAAVHYQF